MLVTLPRGGAPGRCAKKKKKPLSLLCSFPGRDCTQPLGLQSFQLCMHPSLHRQPRQYAQPPKQAQGRVLRVQRRETLDGGVWNTAWSPKPVCPAPPKASAVGRAGGSGGRVEAGRRSRLFCWLAAGELGGPHPWAGRRGGGAGRGPLKVAR